jgi:hypothetical protein
MEIRFEDLNADPRGTVRQLGDFIEHDLNYDRIVHVGIGTVAEPNTSFPSDCSSPVGRWTKKMSSQELFEFESLVGDTLKALGHPLASTGQADWARVARMRATYRAYFEAKFWFKNSALGRACLSPMSGNDIDKIVIAADPARAALAAAPALSSRMIKVRPS